MKTLGEIDYEHWCVQVNNQSPKVYKDEICFIENGEEKCILKKDLQPSPIEMEIII